MRSDGSVAAARPEWVLLSAEAIARGFGTRKHPSLAFRRWLRAHGIRPRVEPGGRTEWVRPIDIDRAIAGERQAPANDVDAEARAAVARFVAEGRG